MSTDTTARERLEAFVGTWSMQAAPAGGPPWPGSASVTFTWMDGAPLLVQRWEIELPEAPNGTAIIGCDGRNDSYFQLYTDERDVQRLYAMSLADGVWRLWREGEPFAQRFTGTFSDDGHTISGRWELSHDGARWETDFDVTYAKVG